MGRDQIRRNVLKRKPSAVSYQLSAATYYSNPRSRPSPVSNSNMRFHWRAILPLCGLLLFGMGTYASLRTNRDFHNGAGRYFWWSALRLDSDPLNKRPSSRTSIPCPDGTETCLPGNALATWVDPGWLSWSFVLSVLPAFLAMKGIVRGLGHFGVSEVTSFFVTMPLLTVAWFYFVGWELDRWHSERVRT